MSKHKKISLFILLSLLVSSHAIGAFVLNGTRFIYEEGQKNISFEVKNMSNNTYGGHIWIDNTIQNKQNVYIIPSPPIFKINKKEKQIIRLMKVNDALPKDRESLFWLNVQELPPRPKKVEGSALALALDTQVKLLYRPKYLAASRKNAEKKITITQRNGSFFLKNPTPFFFAIMFLKSNKKEIKLNQQAAQNIATFSPFSEVSLGKISLNNRVTIGAINDWGGMENYELN